MCAAALACAFGIAACGTHAASAGTGAPTTSTAAPGAVAARVPDGDWLQFNYDAQRTGVGPAATGINASNLRRLSARVVQLPGTVDASAIALHGVRVGGHPRDVLVVTTTYGRTLAIDADTGRRLWEYTPGDIGAYQGSWRIRRGARRSRPRRRPPIRAAPTCTQRARTGTSTS